MRPRPRLRGRRQQSLVGHDEDGRLARAGEHGELVVAQHQQRDPRPEPVLGRGPCRRVAPRQVLVVELRERQVTRRRAEAAGRGHGPQHRVGRERLDVARADQRHRLGHHRRPGHGRARDRERLDGQFDGDVRSARWSSRSAAAPSVSGWSMRWRCPRRAQGRKLYRGSGSGRSVDKLHLRHDLVTAARADSAVRRASASLRGTERTGHPASRAVAGRGRRPVVGDRLEPVETGHREQRFGRRRGTARVPLVTGAPAAGGGGRARRSRRPRGRRSSPAA